MPRRDSPGDHGVLVFNGSECGDMGVITALEIQKRNKKRVSVFVDGEYAFSLSLDDAARLHKGQTLAEADIDALRQQDAVNTAVDLAARFLALRPRSEHEVRRNLADKDIAAPVIDEAMERLRALGYLDDHAFAAFWVQERVTFKPLSPQALRYELRQKGVADSIISDALAAIDADETALRAARGQVRRLRGATQRDFRQKLAAFLQRRGFVYEDVRATIQRLMDELETNDPHYFAKADEMDE